MATSIAIQDITKIYKRKANDSSYFNREVNTPFTALNNVNLEILKGDKIGLIGKNGAGKSTLLKIISNITKPTMGKVKISGKISSLLEVGTGFHLELTGKENIYLNGSILGLKRSEITTLYDEIVTFSGIEESINQKVKKYSSGMQMRLAFAVASHMRSDIIILDEIFTLGDQDFQNKCLHKLNAITKNNDKTILVVSHNMSLVSQICNKACWLDNGQVKKVGNTDYVIKNYLLNYQENSFNLNLDFEITKVHFNKSNLNCLNSFDSDKLIISCTSKIKFQNVLIRCIVYNSNNETILILNNKLVMNEITIKEGNNLLVCDFENFSVPSGFYNMKIQIYSTNLQIITNYQWQFEVFNKDFLYLEPKEKTSLLIKYHWEN